MIGALPPTKRWNWHHLPRDSFHPLDLNFGINYNHLDLVVFREKQMKKDLMEILACPVCKGDLKLEVTEEDDREVITGTLKCLKCRENYPIKDAIPNLLPSDLRGKT